MSRSPLRTRPNKKKHLDDENEEEEHPGTPLPERLTAPIVPLGRPYEGEDEKRQVYTDLIRLKASGKSNRECAAILGVTERTIGNYRADDLYSEIEKDLETEAKARGYHVIGELIQDALGTMYEIMTTEKSGFVRFKAAEALLRYAGYDIPRETAVQSNRDEAVKFLEEVRQRREQVQVNVQINQAPNTARPETTVEVVESNVEQEKPQLPAELAQYYQPVLPGGKLPENFT